MWLCDAVRKKSDRVDGLSREGGERGRVDGEGEGGVDECNDF